ncbi:MAG: hypothetical protein RTV31_17405, partial [Candidatus Thorarchaeota archaeon]
MTSKTKILCVFAVLLFLGSLAASSYNPYSSTVSANTEEMLPAETYGDDRRNDAVSILIQTEYVDTTV